MGCGGSKQEVATENTTSLRRRLLKKKSDVFKRRSSNGVPEVVGPVEDDDTKSPPPPAAAAAAADVKEITVNVEREEEEEGEGRRLVSRDPPDRFFSSRKDEEDVEAITAGSEYNSPRYEMGKEEAEDMPAAAGANLTRPREQNGKLNGKVSVNLKEPILVGEKKVEKHDADIRDIEVNNLRRQVQELKDRLASFGVWSQGDAHQELLEKKVQIYPGDEDLQVINQSIFDDDPIDEDLKNDEDFSNRIPIYDEDPFDLLQIPNFDGDPWVITSYLSLDNEGISNDQVKQVMCKKYVNIRRSKLYVGEKKKNRIHAKFHHKIGKHRKRTKVVFAG